jgi:xylulokinase
MAAVIGAGLMHVGRGVDVGGAAGGVGISVERATAERITTEVGGALWSGPAPASFGEIRIMGGALGGTGILLDATIAGAIAEGADPQTLIHEVASFQLGEAVAVEADRGRAHGAIRVRAAMERGALAVELLLAPARAAGLPLHEMWLSGPATGATNGLLAATARASYAIKQMRADILGVPVVVPGIPEAAAAGAAALAGVGAGCYASLVEAAELLATLAERIDPNPDNAAAAEAARALYRRS